MRAREVDEMSRRSGASARPVAPALIHSAPFVHSRRSWNVLQRNPGIPKEHVDSFTVGPEPT